MTIINDRRNQPYQPGDTILQDLAKLNNADWKSLLGSVQTVAPGDRGYTTLNITLTGDEESTEFYVMFEQWKYVADWSLLVFAPKKEVEHAINVSSMEKASSGTMMEAEKGSNFDGRGTIVNHGNLDVILSAKTFPTWIALPTEMDKSVTLRPGEHKTIDIVVSTVEMNIGLQSSAIVFHVEDANYPDCFFSEDLSLPLSVRATAKHCGHNQVGNEDGVFMCSPDAITISDMCVSQSALLTVLILLPFVILVAVAVYVVTIRKHHAEDSVWKINPLELKLSEPDPEIIGVGSFGVVVMAKYQGTQVAVKLVRCMSMNGQKNGSQHASKTGSQYASGTASKNESESA